MSAVFLILLLLPAGAGVCAVARCQLAEGLAVAMLGLVAAGYLLALAGLLPLLGLLPWAAALAGVILVERRRGDNPAFCRGLWQGAAAFVLLALFYWWLCRGHSLADWDDFSHWGRAAKWMFTTDTLYTVPGCDDGYKSYPPATALWQVMLLQAGRWVWRGFREDILLYANALLTAALLLVPLRAGRGLPAIPAAALLGVTPLLVYPTYFARASVDGLIGVFCAVLLLSAFLPGRSAATPWVEALGCFCLTLVKDAGAGLAALAALTMLAARLWKNRRSALVPAFVPLACVGLAKGSWALHLGAVGAAARWQGEDPLRNIWSLLINNIPDWRRMTIAAFCEAMVRTPNYGAARSLPFLAWPAAFCLLVGLAAALLPRPARKRLAGIGAAGLGVTAAFAGSLFYTYLFMFEPSEAVQLASLYRYLDSCVMLLAVLGGGALGWAACGAPRRSWLALAGWAVGLCLLFPLGPSADKIRYAPQEAAASGADRVLSRHAADRIRALGETAPRLWLITANDGGAAELRIRYDLLPLQLPAHAVILMADVPEGLIWAREISPEDWSRELAESYDYVYIYCPEDQFVADYLSVFEPGSQSEVVNDRMFRVIRQGDGSAKLRCIDGVAAQPMKNAE